LQRGLENSVADDGEVSIDFLVNPAPPPKSGASIAAVASIAAWTVEKLQRIDWLWRVLRTTTSPNVRRIWTLVVSTPMNSHFLPDWAERKLDANDVASVHCHTTLDALRAHNSLCRLGRRDQIKIALTSHSPEIPADAVTGELLAFGLLRSRATRLHGRFLEIDKSAFAAADLIISPCAEAMESYVDAQAGLADIISGKEVRFVLTGVEEPERAEPLDPGGFADELKLVYVGRHNEVKGYDLLTAAIPPFLDRSNSVMLVAGKQAPLAAPRHTRWREFGFLPNPGRLILAGDIVLLPNRLTYFDLLAIEAMSMGRPILASATGGNKILASLSSGIELFTPSVEGLSHALAKIQAQTPEELRKKGAANRAAFEARFTAKIFAENYRRLINEWWRERLHTRQTALTASGQSY
jgi:glycosyltransferase involved in cell wall biosynthesis